MQIFKQRHLFSKHILFKVLLSITELTGDLCFHILSLNYRDITMYIFLIYLKISSIVVISHTIMPRKTQF
jgi:hypothetical protein